MTASREGSGPRALAGTTARVRVPATSANLGPGFDSLGLALGMYDEVELAAGPGTGCSAEVSGEGAGRVPRDERHLVLRAASAVYAHAGVDRPALRLTCRNVIPHSRGLGSSAAAAVAGIVAARALLTAAGGPDIGDDAALELAAGFDGHADNVAACLSGGLVVSWGHEGTYRSARLDPHPAIAPVVLVSERTSSTEATRGLLPDRVPHADAAFTAARTALAVHAFTTAPALLMPGTEDRLHQPYRRPAYPATAALVDALRDAGVPATVSGAGPSVLALTTSGELPDGLETSGFTAHALPVALGGARVELVG